MKWSLGTSLWEIRSNFVDSSLGLVSEMRRMDACFHAVWLRGQTRQKIACTRSRTSTASRTYIDDGMRATASLGNILYRSLTRSCTEMSSWISSTKCPAVWWISLPTDVYEPKFLCRSVVRLIWEEGYDDWLMVTIICWRQDSLKRVGVPMG